MIRRINAVTLIAIPIAALAGMMVLAMAGGTETSLGAFTTSLEARSQSQRHNIERAAQALDGVVVRPGKVFSFNRTVGARTTGRGYVPAPAIIEGELVESPGGGVCQVSSTLYNAALVAGMAIVERSAHSYPVSSVPPGRDATVVTRGADLSFRNTSGTPITIRTSADASSLVIRIVSPGKPDFKCRIAVETSDSIRPITIGREVNGLRYTTATVWREHIRDGLVTQREFISSDRYVEEVHGSQLTVRRPEGRRQEPGVRSQNADGE